MTSGIFRPEKNAQGEDYILRSTKAMSASAAFKVESTAEHVTISVRDEAGYIIETTLKRSDLDRVLGTRARGAKHGIASSTTLALPLVNV